MFCMNCGQQLPDGAKFCMKCGTPQGAVSPFGTPQEGTINSDGTHTFVPAMCPNCGSHMNVDSSYKIARCDTCGTECLVQDAIKTLNVNGNVQVGNATINVNGTNTESLLQRVEIMISDGELYDASQKCKTILDSDPTNGKAYFYLLMTSLFCKEKEDLANKFSPFDDNKYYSKVMKYGDESLKSELLEYNNSARMGFINRLKNLKTGDEFPFATGYEDYVYRWKVLDIRDNMALIFSSNNIYRSWSYDASVGPITWADCSMRKWLNNDVFNTYFTSAEKARILPCNLPNENNPENGTPGGVSTTDKIFLLSIREANHLFPNDQSRANGSWWWLRSPGDYPNKAAVVSENGVVSSTGFLVAHSHAVRPALWIKID